MAQESDSTLAARLALPEAEAPGQTTDEDKRVIEFAAAPAAMWRDVPRHLLPTISVSGPLARVPRTGEPWRVQAVTVGLASPWVDIAPEQDRVSLELLPAVEHEFGITAEAQPHPGARVSLVRPSRRGMQYPTELLAFETADGEGAARFVLPESEDPPAVVASVTRAAQAFPRLSDVPKTIELSPGLVVRGQTVNEREEPIADARISGLSWIPDGFGLMQRHEGTSRPDGRFEISGFAAGDASLDGRHGDLEFSRHLQLEGTVDLGRVILASPESLWVRVVDRLDRRVVPDANVQIAQGDWTKTGPDGIARLVSGDSRSLLVHKNGYLHAQTEAPLGAGTSAEEPFDVALEAAFSVRGVFLAADGVTPARDGQLVAKREFGNRSTNRFGVIDDDGAFSIDLEAGAYSLELVAGNAGRKRVQASGGARETLDLGVVVAPPAAWVSGHVVDSEYAPVAEASVLHVPPSESGERMAWAFGQVAMVETDADGYFEMHGIEPGRAALRVEAQGFAPAEFEFQAEPLRWTDAGVIELSRGRRIAVRSNAKQGLVVLDPGARNRPRDEMRATLREGEAVFDTVPAGLLGVRVLEDGAVVCEKTFEDRGGDQAIRCDRNVVRVSGRVTMGGRPGGGTLLWRQSLAQEEPGGVIRSLGGRLPRTQVVASPAHEQQAGLDADGRYTLPAVLPGAWEVIWVSLDGGAQAARKVTVPDGADEIAQDFDYAGVSLAGRVVDDAGEPAYAATVDLFPGRRHAIAGRDGRFQFLGLEPGAYQARARLRHLRSRLVSVQLAASDDREEVHLTLEDDAPSEELVIEAGGGDGFCFVEPSEGSSLVRRIEDGSARVRLEPPLAERVRAACRIDGRWVFGGWGSLEQAFERGIAFEPHESTAALDLTGEASSRARVRITAPGGWDLGRLRQWFGGTATFSVGETITGLPVGEYTLRWGDRAWTVRSNRRDVTEVEIGD